MLVSFSIFPVGEAESLSTEVAKIIHIIDNSGLPYKMSSMATTIEGKWDEIMAVVDQCRRELRKNNNRIYMNLVMDDRKSAENRITGKVEAIENKLNREVCK